MNSQEKDEMEDPNEAHRGQSAGQADPQIEIATPEETQRSEVRDQKSEAGAELDTDAKLAIFAAGEEAGKGGLDAEHCPYSEGDERAAMWLRGHKVGAESRPPDKAMAAAATIDEAARVPDRFRSLVIGRVVYYADRVNSDQIGELPAIVTRVVNQAEGLVNLQVVRNDPTGMAFTQNVSYEPSGDVRKTWRWPQGE